MDLAIDKQHAHQLLDKLDTGQLSAVVHLLEVLTDPMNSGEDPLTGGDRQAVAESGEWFERNPEGIPFEQVVAECGLTMNDVKSYKDE